MHPTILLQLAELRIDERLHAATRRRLTRRAPRTRPTAPPTARPAGAAVSAPRPVPARTRTHPAACDPQAC